jgi:competence protein ComEC
MGPRCGRRALCTIARVSSGGLALALVVGAACGAQFDLAVRPLVIAALLSILAAVVARWQCWLYLSWSLAAVACASGGVALASHARAEALHSSIRIVLERRSAGFSIDTLEPPAPLEPIPARIVLLEDAASSAETTTLRARARALYLERAWTPVDGGLIVSVGGALTNRRGEEWTAGRVLALPLSFRRPARYLDDGVPDFERDLALDGVALFASVKSGLLVDVRARGSVVQEGAARVRAGVRGRVGRWVGARDPLSAAIVTAVLIGDRTGLPDEVRERLQAAGTYHVIAISGGNIAILAALCLVLLRLVGLAGRPAALLTLLVLLAYAQVVTAGASVWRATVMASLYLVARLLDHRSPPWHAWSMTAALVVCVHPLDVRDVGFLLTFGATAALLHVASLVSSQDLRRGSSRSALLRWMFASIAASLAAEAVLLPVSAHAFSRVTSAGLVLNLLAVPLMGIVQVAGMAVVACDRMAWVAAVAGWLAHTAARLLVESATLVDVVPGLIARVPPPSLATVVVYYAALTACVFGRHHVRRAGGCVLIVTVVVIAGVLPLERRPANGTEVVRLTMFDVGQGESLLLQSSDARPLLIDTGGAPFGGGGFDIGGRVLAPALWARGVRRLDTLLLTHGDPDHIGGALAVLRDFVPAHVWQGIPVLRHLPLQEVLRDARDRGIAVAERIAPAEFALGRARVRILHPPPADWERPRVRNDDSVVLEVTFGDIALLLTGDIGAAIERDILPHLTPARIRILKVAHHGSRTSSSQELLDAWRPRIALISAGRGNTFGHPAPDVVRRLESIGAAIYRTDRQGQITLETDGRDVHTTTYAGDRQ